MDTDATWVKIRVEMSPTNSHVPQFLPPNYLSASRNDRAINDKVSALKNGLSHALPLDRGK